MKDREEGKVSAERFSRVHDNFVGWYGEKEKNELFDVLRLRIGERKKLTGFTNAAQSVQSAHLGGGKRRRGQSALMWGPKRAPGGLLGEGRKGGTLPRFIP